MISDLPKPSSAAVTSGHNVLQHALTNQLLTFPPWQEVLWTETDVRMTTSCLTTVYDPDIINQIYSSSRRRSSFLFWPDCSSSAGSQFHRRSQTLRDPLNTSPERHHEAMWSVLQQTNCQTSASLQILETSRAWQWSTNTSETEYRWVSPRCKDSSGASCPAWCPDPRPHPETAWRRPETSYTDWTTAAGTTHIHTHPSCYRQHKLHLTFQQHGLSSCSYNITGSDVTLTSSAHMWKRTLAGSTLPYSQRSALILSRRSYLPERRRVQL